MPTEHAFPSTGGRGRTPQIIAPFQFETTGEDHLRVRIWNNASANTVEIRGRQRLADGTYSPFDHFITPTTDRTLNEKLIALSAGYVVTLSAASSTTATEPGQCFVQVDLVRGFSGGLITLGTLLQGYVGGFAALSWPGSPLRTALEGPGFIATINGSNPGAGQEISQLVPQRVRWRLLSFQAVLLTSAVVATRTAALFVTNTLGSNIAKISAPYGHLASQAIEYYWFAGMPMSAAPSLFPVVQGFPADLPIKAGFFLRTVTNNLDAGDDWSAPTYTVEQWLDVWS